MHGCSHWIARALLEICDFKNGLKLYHVSSNASSNNIQLQLNIYLLTCQNELYKTVRNLELLYELKLK